MPVRLTWDDNNPNEEAHEVYRSDQPMDVESMPAPLAVLDPNTTSYDDDTAGDNETYFYRVAAVRNGVRAYSEELEVLVEPTGGGPDNGDLANAEIGDEIAGGIYAGTLTIDGTVYYIIAGKAESEVYGLQWKTSQTGTAGTTSLNDGLANTLAMEAAGLADHPTGEHCRGYAVGDFTDWYMPARDELTLLYNNLRTHSEFATNVSSGNYTWTSSEISASSARSRRLSDGGEFSGLKTNTSRRVRPIRRVPV